MREAARPMIRMCMNRRRPRAIDMHPMQAMRTGVRMCPNGRRPLEAVNDR